MSSVHKGKIAKSPNVTADKSDGGFVKIYHTATLSGVFCPYELAVLSAMLSCTKYGFEAEQLPKFIRASKEALNAALMRLQQMGVVLRSQYHTYPSGVAHNGKQQFTYAWHVDWARVEALAAVPRAQRGSPVAPARVLVPPQTAPQTAPPPRDGFVSAETLAAFARAEVARAEFARAEAAEAEFARAKAAKSAAKSAVILPHSEPPLDEPVTAAPVVASRQGTNEPTPLSALLTAAFGGGDDPDRAAQRAASLRRVQSEIEGDAPNPPQTVIPTAQPVRRVAYTIDTAHRVYADELLEIYPSEPYKRRMDAFLRRLAKDGSTLSEADFAKGFWTYWAACESAARQSPTVGQSANSKEVNRLLRRLTHPAESLTLTQYRHAFEEVVRLQADIRDVRSVEAWRALCVLWNQGAAVFDAHYEKLKQKSKGS